MHETGISFFKSKTLLTEKVMDKAVKTQAKRCMEVCH